MRILVTGHRGFIGGHAVRHFSQSHQVDTYDWHPTERPTVENYDWVLHFGGISSTTEKDVDKIMGMNYDFTVWLYDQCRRSGTNLQYSSSASVYGNTDHFREDGPVDPQSPYAWSKYLTERYIKANPSTSTVAQGFRYFNVYGSDEGDKPQPSPHTAFRRQAESGSITLYVSDREPLRDFVPVERVIQVQEKFLSIPESGVWNIGSGETRSFRDIAQEVSLETGVPITEKSLPNNMAAQYQWYTCANLDHLNATLERHGQ